MMAGARLVPVPVDGEGLDVEAGLASCPRPRAVYVTPSHQLPLGMTMSASRRLGLLDWARRRGVWIIEDDYDGEYRYGNLPVASLQGLDRDSRVIYIGTFTKSLFPAIRLGYLVLPPDLVALSPRPRAMDLFPPPFIQSVLADFIEEGHFDRHLRRTRLLCRQRRRALIAALDAQLGGVLRVIGDEAGMFLTTVLEKGYRDRDVAGRAALQGVRTFPLGVLHGGRRGARAGPRVRRVHRKEELVDGVTRLRAVLDAG